jgi:cation transporter-like permease
MKWLAVAFIQRLLVSVAIIILIGGFGIVYGHLFGPSKIAGGASIVLIAWPWALPQIFVVVCVVWFIFQLILRKRRRPAL